MAKIDQEDVGFNDDVKIVDFRKKYEGRKGKRDRLAFVLLNAAGKPDVKKALTHYVAGVGYFLANDSTIKKFGKPKARYVTLIGVYETDDFGKVLDQKNVKVEVWNYVMSEAAYKTLKQANDQFPLEKYDVLATCTDDKYKTLQFQSCNGAAWVLIPTVKADVLAQVEIFKPNLLEKLCQNLSDAEIEAKLKCGGTTAPSRGPATSIDTDTIIADL